MGSRPHRRVSFLVIAGLITVNGLFASMWYAASGLDAVVTGAELGIVLIAITATFGIVRLLVTASAVPGPRVRKALPETGPSGHSACPDCSRRSRALVVVD